MSIARSYSHLRGKGVTVGDVQREIESEEVSFKAHMERLQEIKKELEALEMAKEKGEK